MILSPSWFNWPHKKDTPSGVSDRVTYLQRIGQVDQVLYQNCSLVKLQLQI